MSIAVEIVRQIKALDKWAMASWGANSYMHDENSLEFATRNHKHGRHNKRVKVTLDLTNDLYNVQAFIFNPAKLERQTINEFKGIEVASLVSTIDNLLTA